MILWEASAVSLGRVCEEFNKSHLDIWVIPADNLTILNIAMEYHHLKWVSHL